MKKKVKKGLKIKGFTIQFLPYSEIRDLDSDKRVKKILGIVMNNNILLIQGRLRPEEETRLIEETMDMIHQGKNDFLGIELAVISDNGDSNFFSKIKKSLVNALSGGDLGAVTIVGPATIVKEIKKNPKKIELLLDR